MIIERNGIFFKVPDSPFDSRRYGPTALLLAGTGLMAGSQIYSGIAAREEAKNAEAVADYNASVMEQEAKSIEAKAKFDSIRQAEEAARIKGSLTAELGTSGVDVSVGAPLLLIAKQASESELDNLMIGYEGYLAASRARSQATNYKLQGDLAKQRGRNKMIGSFMGAGGSLLTGFAGFGGSPSTASNAATGSGAYGGTMGGGPTGGGSRSMIG